MKSYFVKPSFLLLGCISGIPLAFSGTILQLYFAGYGLPVAAIGSLSLLGLPYSCKFLGAPALEKYFKGPCPYKFWMSVTLPLMGFLILVSGLLRPDQHLYALMFLGLMVAVASSIFDTVFDAYRLLLSSNDQLGKNSTYSAMGYRFGMLISGGLGLIFCDRFGFQAFYQAMGLLLLLLSNYIFLLPTQNQEQQDVDLSLKDAYLEAFREIKGLNHLWLLLLILSSYRFCDALLSALSSYYLKEVLGYSLTSIGLIYKISGPLATISGSMAAGYLIDKHGLKKLMNPLCLMQGIANWSYLWLYYQPLSSFYLLFVVFVENFFSGMATCALVVFLSQLVVGLKHKATGYALFSCSFAFTRALSGICASFLINLLGWPNFIIISSVFVLIPMIAYSHYLIEQEKEIINRKVQSHNLQEDVHSLA